MKDAVAEAVADNIIKDLVSTLESHGLHRHSIIAGIELALKRLREDVRTKH